MASEIIPFEQSEADALFDALSDRQKAFVSAYVGECRFNATNAAVIAGYDRESAMDNAWRLRANEGVNACIRARLKANLLTDEVILTELGNVALSPTSNNQQMINEFISKDGKQVTQIIRLDYASKVKALEILAKAAGLLTDRVAVEVTEKKTFIGINIEAMRNGNSNE